MLTICCSDFGGGEGMYLHMHWKGGVSQHALARGVCPGRVSAHEGSAQGGVCLGVSSQAGSAQGDVCHTHPVDSMTETCENIIFPQLRCGRL